MEFLLIALMLVTPLFALYATGRFAAPASERTDQRGLAAVWSSVARGNELVAPTTPYEEYARR